MPRLLIADRETLIEEIAGHTIEQRRNLKEAHNYQQLYRYTGLIGLMGAVNFPHLVPHHAQHIRRMIGWEANSITELKRPPRTASQFWAAVEAEAKNEIDFVRSLEDGRVVPTRPFLQAKADLLEVKQYAENPLIAALRETVAGIQNRKP